MEAELAPPLPDSERQLALPAHSASIAAAFGNPAMPALLRALTSKRDATIPTRKVIRELSTALLPAIVFAVIMGLTWHSLTKPDLVTDTSGLQEMGTLTDQSSSAPVTREAQADGVQEPPAEGLQEPPAEGLQEPPVEGVKEPQNAAPQPAPAAAPAATPVSKPAPSTDWQRLPTPATFWIVFSVGGALLALLYAMFTFTRLEIFKMLLTSFFPLAVMILAVLGTIVFGLATPTEAAAIGSFGGFVLAAVYYFIGKTKALQRKVLPLWIPLWILFGVSVVWFILFKAEVLHAGPPAWVGWLSMSAIGVWCVAAVLQVGLLPTIRESSFLTAKTSAMVCWLFVGSSIFSAAFALLGGQNIVEQWVLSLNMTPVQFLLLSQFIIFILGWPLEWTEIIVIFMPIFIPLLAHFNIDPLFFGLLVALNLQTAFLSPPVAMAAFYLKGVAPPHVTLNQIFAGMMPFMAIQVLAMALLYMWPAIGMWLPSVLYK